MKKKKIFVHGTPESLQKFLSDAVSRDFEIIAFLSEEPEKISIQRNDLPLEVLRPIDLPKCIYELIDGIVLTDLTANKGIVRFFLNRGLAPRKIIPWDANEGWGDIHLPEADGTEVVCFCGLEFHIRNQADAEFFAQMHDRLQAQQKMKNLNPKFYPAFLSDSFRLNMRETLDLNDPHTFTEKLQWLKIFDATPLKSRLTDKYLVRSWITEKIGDQYLIPLLGVWDGFDDIDFDALPAQFVLKCNHGSAMNIIVHDKKTFDKQRAREKINAWLATDYGTFMELHYTRINRKIIAEKYITDMRDGVIDYKFHCFDGKPEFVQVIGDRNFAKHTRYQKFCDLDYNDIGAMFEDYPHFPYEVPAPKEFEKMKEFAELLSQGFSYVRVDFYEIEGKILFGEMTFTSDSGYLPHKRSWTYEKDLEVGSLLKLPAATPPPIL